MGVSEDDLHTMFNQISFVGLVALDEMLNVGGERGESTTLATNASVPNETVWPGKVPVVEPATTETR